MTTMKPIRLYSRSFTLLALGTMLTGMLLFAGCATAHQPKEQARVCPECTMTEVTVESSSPGSDFTTLAASSQMDHTCPHCQGAMKTFFKEGKLRHKCSLCAQTAFVCPANHRL